MSFCSQKCEYDDQDRLIEKKVFHKHHTAVYGYNVTVTRYYYRSDGTSYSQTSEEYQRFLNKREEWAWNGMMEQMKLDCERAKRDKRNPFLRKS